MKKCRSILLIGSLPLLLVACGGGGKSFHGRIQCAPYARSLTGVKLSGSAGSWWNQSKGLYARSNYPSKGAILVFRSTSRLPYGHVSVVKKVKDSRTILVDQANWEPQEIDHKVPIVDVSSSNNWTAVRVWWKPTGKMGARRYPTYGFILPDSADHS